MGEITAWLAQARAGDAAALDRVFAMLYPELRRLAQSRAAAGERTLTPTVLVHEVYLKLIGSEQLALSDRCHFLGCAAHAMRTIAIDHARRRQAAKRGGGNDVALDDIAFALGTSSDDELVELDAAIESLGRANPRLRQVVELHFFAGLGFEQVAELMSCSLRTAKREWERARAFLHLQLATEP